MRTFIVYFIACMAAIMLLYFMAVSVDRGNCKRYAEATEREMKYVDNQCYIKTNAGWYRRDQIRSN